MLSSGHINGGEEDGCEERREDFVAKVKREFSLVPAGHGVPGHGHARGGKHTARRPEQHRGEERADERDRYAAVEIEADGKPFAEGRQQHHGAKCEGFLNPFEDEGGRESHHAGSAHHADEGAFARVGARSTLHFTLLIGAHGVIDSGNGRQRCDLVAKPGTGAAAPGRK